VLSSLHLSEQPVCDTVAGVFAASFRCRFLSSNGLP